MTHLQIFTPDTKAAAISAKSDKIVDTLASNYSEMIDNMVGKKELTRKTYTRNAEPFIAFIQDNGIHAHTVAMYRNALEDADMAQGMRANLLTAAKALCKEAHRYGVIPMDITAGVPAFRTERGHKKDGLTHAQVECVAAHIRNLSNPVTRRKLLAIFHLFAMEGLRQMEVQQLKVDDFNFDEAYIMVMGKGRHEKTKFYIMAATVEAVRQYVEAEQILTGWLFPSRTDLSRPISLRAIRKHFTSPKYGIFAKCGIKNKSVHGFRHYNITRTLQITGGDLAKTRRRSRHRGYDMLVVYDDERLSREDVAGLEEHFAI